MVDVLYIYTVMLNWYWISVFVKETIEWIK